MFFFCSHFTSFLLVLSKIGEVIVFPALRIRLSQIELSRSPGDQQRREGMSAYWFGELYILRLATREKKLLICVQFINISQLN